MVQAWCNVSEERLGYERDLQLSKRKLINDLRRGVTVCNDSDCVCVCQHPRSTSLFDRRCAGVNILPAAVLAAERLRRVPARWRTLTALGKRTPPFLRRPHESDSLHFSGCTSRGQATDNGGSNKNTPTHRRKVVRKSRSTKAQCTWLIGWNYLVLSLLFSKPVMPGKLQCTVRTEKWKVTEPKRHFFLDVRL